MTTFAWVGGSLNWDSGSSWTPTGGPPTATDTVTINATGTYAVTIDSADVAQTVILSRFRLVDQRGDIAIGCQH
jgi:hypothetical protein